MSSLAEKEEDRLRVSEEARAGPAPEEERGMETCLIFLYYLNVSLMFRSLEIGMGTHAMHAAQRRCAGFRGGDSRCNKNTFPRGKMEEIKTAF